MSQYLGNLVYDQVTIANGGTVSDAKDLQGRGLVSLIIPAAFTGTSVSFQTSPDNVTFQACYNSSNTLMSMTVTQGRTYMISPSDFAGARYLKVVSNAAEGAARTIGLISREMA